MRKTKLLVAVSGVWSILEEEGAASHGHAGGLGVSWRRTVELLAGMSRAQGILYHLACWLVTRPINADRAGRHETKFEPVVIFVLVIELTEETLSMLVLVLRLDEKGGRLL